MDTPLSEPTLTEEEKTYNDQIILHEIIQGYSACSLKELNPDLEGELFYFKHLTSIDRGCIAFQRTRYKKGGAEKGLLSEKETLELLIKTNNWSKKEETTYQRLNLEVKNLENTKNQIFLESQRKIITTKLEEAYQKIKKLTTNRESLLGLTLEAYVNQRMETYILWYSLYKNTNLKDRLYEEFDDFYNLSADQCDTYGMLFSLKMIDYAPEALKRIAVNSQFLICFIMTEGNPLAFFGKVAVELSTYQLMLLNYARGFKNVLDNAEKEMPDLENVDQIVKWLETERDRLNDKYKQGGSAAAPSSRRTSKNSQFQAISVPAATEEESAIVGDREGAGPFDLKTAANKMKKELGKDTLNTHDMARLHGLI